MNSDATQLEQRLSRLEETIVRAGVAVEEIYAHLMGRSVDALRQRWQRTQQELSVPVRRADLHSHTTYSDGTHSVAEMERWRQRFGLDLLGITDHNTLSHADDCRPYPQIYVGEEVTGRHHHVLIHRPSALLQPEHNLHHEVANIRAVGRLPLVAHPTGWMRHIYDDERIQSVRELDGVFLMEIANGAANWFNYHDSTDDSAVTLWDQLLLAGTSVVAVGNSDAHRAANVGLIWNGVVEESTAPEVIYQAIAAGRGFVSNGPVALLWADGEATAVTPRRPAATVHLSFEVADSAGLSRWRLLADGRTWQEGSVEGQHAFRQEFDAPARGVHSYRLECVAADGRHAYTNPVRLG